MSHHEGMRDIPIEGEMIRLGQFLKLAAVAESGSEAKELLGLGLVAVNGAPEDRRGRQLHRGDVVSIDDEEMRVV